MSPTHSLVFVLCMIHFSIIFPYRRVGQKVFTVIFTFFKNCYSHLLACAHVSVVCCSCCDLGSNLSDKVLACYTAVNMATVLFIYTKEEQRGVICLFWPDVSGAESCQYGNDVLLQCSVTIGLKRSEMVTQVSKMNGQAALPHPPLLTILNMLVMWFWQIGVWLLMR